MCCGSESSNSYQDYTQIVVYNSGLWVYKGGHRYDVFIDNNVYREELVE